MVPISLDVLQKRVDTLQGLLVLRLPIDIVGPTFVRKDFVPV